MNAAEFHRLAHAFDEATSGQTFALEQDVELDTLLRFDRDPPLLLSDWAISTLACVRNWLLSTECEADPEAGLPEQIAGYPILGVLGIGGSSVVYRARQFNPTREVALKVMRPGLTTPSMRRRFEYEAEVLAQLQHAGIAQIYASGLTEEGAGARPYLVMELVWGQPITRYAHERELDIEGRLRLFLSVCEGVEHAHNRGVIHHDLKPANILVTESGDPKIVDFGIARLAEATFEQPTQLGSGRDLLGTIAYMSPEQFSASDVGLDTRCDTYALGVVLYELITGSLPIDVSGRTIAEAIRMIAEVTPRKLGAIDRSLRGDLEAIVEKALHSDPDARYQSPYELAEDLTRFLGHRPVEARRGGVLYQFSRFARRNRAVVATAMTGVVLLVAATVVMTTQAVHNKQLANEEASARGRAEARFSEVRQLARMLIYDLYDELGNVPGSTSARQMLATTALTYLDALASESGEDVSLLQEVADSYLRVGDVLGNPVFGGHLGDTGGALDAYERAIEVHSRIANIAPGDLHQRIRLAEALLHRAELLRAIGRDASALARFREVIAFMENSATESERSGAISAVLRDAYLGLARTYALSLRSRGTETDLSNLRTYLDLSDQYRVLAGGHDQYEPRTRALLQMERARMNMHLRAPRDFLQEFKLAIEYGEEAMTAVPTDRAVACELHDMYMFVGEMYMRMPDFDGADEQFQASLRLAERLATLDPIDVSSARLQSFSEFKLGEVSLLSGHPEEAADWFEQSLARIEPIADHDDPLAMDHLARRYRALAEADFELLRYDEAARNIVSYAEALVGSAQLDRQVRGWRDTGDLLCRMCGVDSMDEKARISYLTSAMTWYAAAADALQSVVDSGETRSNDAEMAALIQQRIAWCRENLTAMSSR